MFWLGICWVKLIALQIVIIIHGTKKRLSGLRQLFITIWPYNILSETKQMNVWNRTIIVWLWLSQWIVHFELVLFNFRKSSVWFQTIMYGQIIVIYNCLRTDRPNPLLFQCNIGIKHYEMLIIGRAAGMYRKSSPLRQVLATHKGWLMWW